MQFKFSSKSLKDAPKGYVRVRLISEGQGRFVVDNTVEYLDIKLPKKPEEMNLRNVMLLCRSVISTAKANKIKKIALEMGKPAFPAIRELPVVERGSLMAQNFEMANYEFTKYKKEPKDGWNIVDEVLICGDFPKELSEGFKKGKAVGAEVNACRELANTPGKDMTPKILAATAKSAIKGTKATLKVLGKREMEKLGLGAVLGVAQGSVEEPQFIIVEYWGKGNKLRGDAFNTNLKASPQGSKPLVLIGKGVTFDSGGLNVKGGDHMYEMHMDMSGGAAVIHSVALAAKLNLKVNVVGLVPAVENMPSGTSIRPGDMLKSLSGRTIEVLNTDAEGRIILADAITYAKRYDPVAVVDAATLTGAALVALGTQYSGVMANDDAFRDKLVALGNESGDYVWPFPMGEEYEGMVKGHFGDVPNISTEGSSRYGGVIAGGMFLREFAKDLSCPFAHLDIAPRMTAAPNEYLAKGAAGAPVRLFLKLIESFEKK